MKITITNYNRTYSAETEEDVDAESLADMFKGLMVNMGYHPTNVDELFNTEYKWFTQEERDENMQGHKKYNYTDPDHPMYLAQEEDHMEAYNRGYAKGLNEAKHQGKVEQFQNNLYRQDDDDIFNQKKTK